MSERAAAWAAALFPKRKLMRRRRNKRKNDDSSCDLGRGCDLSGGHRKPGGEGVR